MADRDLRELDAEVAFRLFGDAGGPRIQDRPPHYTTRHDAMALVLAEMERRGYHARLTTPFMPGGKYFAGFTPHGVTGWNGRPDYAVGAETLPLAVARAALLCVDTAPALPPLEATVERVVEACRAYLVEPAPLPDAMRAGDGA